MKFQIIPKQQIVLIYTKKSNDDICSSLEKKIGKKNGTRFLNASKNFVIERTLGNSSGSTIIANGSIFNGTENIIRIEVLAKDTYLFFFAICWYLINVLIASFMIIFFILEETFSFFILLPLVFIFIGYGLTTAVLQGAMDEMIGEIKEAVK